jgi:hypothetical protein
MLVTWRSFLSELCGVVADSAILSLQGARCGIAGAWAASQAEEVNYSRLLKNIGSAQAKGLTYQGTKFIITRAVDDTLFAQLGKEGIVLQKSILIIVAAHYVDGHVPSQVAGKVAKVVTQLSSLGV